MEKILGNKRRASGGGGLAVGITIGVALGAAMDNTGIGIAIGVAIGAALGAAQRRREPDTDHPGQDASIDQPPN